MLKLVARRLLAMVPILFGVILVSFALLELMPGDPATTMAGEEAVPEVIERIRAQLHLDDPLWERFGRYVWDVSHGDLGRSPLSGISVWSRITAVLPVTLSLVLVGTVFAVIIGVAAGTLAATRRDRLADRLIAVVTSVMQAAPLFVVGLALVILFAVERSWFPASGYVHFGDDPWQWFRHLVLPGVALALVPAAQVARQTRGALVDTLEQDYIRAIRAKGLRETSVVFKHAAKNAATPVVTVVGLHVGAMVGSAVLVELIFGISGFGTMAFNAVLTRDVVLLQGIVLVSAVGVLVTNLAVDISYGYFNPRERG